MTLCLPRAAVETRIGSHARDELIDDAPQDEALGRILVVDDDPEVAAALQGIVEKIGYEVTVAIGPEAALEALQAARPDLVLSDITMPGGLNGVELGREIRARSPGMPILLISGNPRAMGNPQEFPVVAKPITSAKLSDAIARHLERREGAAVVPLFDAGRASRS
jgi:DNA-binding NtrC family response regulator